jgi:hypothetical protein
LRALFWPTIRNETDFDYVTRQGFWICFIVAAGTVGLSLFTGSIAWGVFEGSVFFLAGVGLRERSRVAGLVAFTAYLLSGLVLQRYTGNGFGIGRIIFLALLLANIRGNWLSARWDRDPQLCPARLNQTLGDKLADQLPTFLWPKVRYVFYVLAVLELALLLFALFAPQPAPVAKPTHL